MWMSFNSKLGATSQAGVCVRRFFVWAHGMCLSACALALLAASGCSQAPAPGPAVPEHWPTNGWHWTSPESQGIDSDAVFYPYDGETPHDVASVTKSVTTTLLGAAMQEGLLDGLNRPIAALLLRDASSLDRAKQQITLEHLASMRSGFACGNGPGEPELIAMMQSQDWVGFTLDVPMSDPPGRRFAYCSPGMHLLSAAITELTTESEAQFAAHALFSPMGIVPGDWPRDRTGLNHGWGDLRLRPRDMAKLGLLMLHDGVWNGQRLLPKGWVAMATRSLGPAGARCRRSILSPACLRPGRRTRRTCRRSGGIARARRPPLRSKLPDAGQFTGH